MGKCRVGIAVLLVIAAFFAGCSGGGENAFSVAPVADPAITQTTSVRFEIAAPAPAGNLRAETGVVPQVFFELRLLDRNSSTMPVIRMVRQGQVVAEGTGYTATARFENVPVLPAVASMSINGGYLAGAGGQNYKIWVGKKDLVAASENTVTLVGSGDKSATDVAVNLLDRLIGAPANVATLALPIFEKVDGIVAGLDLNSSTVYEQALLAYNAAYAPTPVPADAEFMPPSDYASLAYPKKDSSVSLTIPAFAAASEAWVLLMNRNTSSLSPSWSVPKAAAASIRAAQTEVSAENEDPITPGQKFQLFLRKYRPMIGVSANSSARPAQLKAAVRAVAINDTLSFKAYLDDTMTLATVTGVCKKIAEHANGRKTLFFVDVDDAALTGIDSILTAIYDTWKNSGGIYDNNRLIFGEEPPGTFNSSNLDDYGNTDLYILISRRIFTAGYFWSADLFPDSADGNNKKIFFMQLHDDLSDITRVVNDISATMAHEFQHMIHYWQKRKLPEADPWLEEAMSGYAEHANGYRIENQKNQSKALQANYYFDRISSIRVEKWHLETDSSQVVSAHYGKAFLFGIWLAQNYGSNGSVQNLLSVQSTEKAAVEAFTGETFDKTFAKFMLAMAVNDTSGGTYGFKGLDLTTTYTFGAGWSPVTLTGPKKSLVNVSLAGSSGTSLVAPYAASYVKVIGGNGKDLTVNASLPSGISLFQLHR